MLLIKHTLFDMKLKQLLPLLLLALSPLALSAQQHPLMGLWQLQVQDGRRGKMQMMDVPVWKSIDGDGTFRTFMLGEKAHCFITQTGTYAIRSDSTYAEQILENTFDAEAVGTVNMLTYSIVNKDMLVVSYVQRGETQYEMWRRVVAETPARRRPPHGPDASDIED